jgi:hypothetical protein
MDSIRFSREPTQYPKAARMEVAEDVASLSDESAAAPTSAVSARSSAANGAGSEAAAAEYSPSLWLGLTNSARSQATAPYIPLSASECSLHQQTSEITPEVMPAGLEQSEPCWLANPDQPTATQEPARVSASRRREAQICSRGASAPRWQPGVSQGPSSGCVTEVICSEGAAGLEGSDQTEARVERRDSDWAAAARSIPASEDHAQRGAPIDAAGSGSASEIDPALALQAQDQADALGPGSQVADPASVESVIEECWLALRRIAARWLNAINGYMMETYP